MRQHFFVSHSSLLLIGQMQSETWHDHCNVVKLCVTMKSAPLVGVSRVSAFKPPDLKWISLPCTCSRSFCSYESICCICFILFRSLHYALLFAYSLIQSNWSFEILVPELLNILFIVSWISQNQSRKYPGRIHPSPPKTNYN